MNIETIEKIFTFLSILLSISPLIIGIFKATKISNKWVSLENESFKIIRYLFLYILFIILTLFGFIIILINPNINQSLRISVVGSYSLLIIMFLMYHLRNLVFLKGTTWIRIFLEIIIEVTVLSSIYILNGDKSLLNIFIALVFLIHLIDLIFRYFNIPIIIWNKLLNTRPDVYYFNFTQLFIVITSLMILILTVLYKSSENPLIHVNTLSLYLFSIILYVGDLIKGFKIIEKYKFGFLDLTTKIIYSIEYSTDDFYIIKPFINKNDNSDKYLFNWNYTQKTNYIQNELIIKKDNISKYIFVKNKIIKELFFSYFLYNKANSNKDDEIMNFKNDIIEVINTKYSYNTFEVKVKILKKCSEVSFCLHINDKHNNVNKFIPIKENNKFMKDAVHSFNVFIYDQIDYIYSIYHSESNHNECKWIKIISIDEYDNLNK